MQNLENWEVARETCLEAVEAYSKAKKLWRRAVKECAESISLAELAVVTGDYLSADAYLECAGNALKLANNCRSYKKIAADKAAYHYRQLKEDKQN